MELCFMDQIVHLLEYITSNDRHFGCPIAYSDMNSQECIPVGCILPACWLYPSMHWCPVQRGCIQACTGWWGWVYSSMHWAGGVWPGGCLPRGCLSRGWCLPGGVCPGGACLGRWCLPRGVWQTPSMDKQIPVKT